MSEMKYTEDHEWLRLEDDGTVTVGITDHAQKQLGDLVYVELPEVDKAVSKGEEVAVIESVKAAADIKAPAAGTITAVNEALGDAPNKVNEDPTGEGWFFRMQTADPGEFDNLMDEDAYERFIED